jgi:hypothetical protein
MSKDLVSLFGPRQREVELFVSARQQEALPQRDSTDCAPGTFPVTPTPIITCLRPNKQSPLPLKSPSATDGPKCLLLLETEQWFAVADEVRQGRCHVKNLALGMVQSSSAEATEAIKALASAIRVDRNLEHLTLRMENGFSDEAGVALAEALTVNKTLRVVKVGDTLRPDYHVRNKDTWCPRLRGLERDAACQYRR